MKKLLTYLAPALLLVLFGTVHAQTTAKKGGWDDEDPLDDLIAIAKTFRKKQKADGSLDPRHAKAFTAMLKQAGKSKAPLPVVVALLDELWATKTLANADEVAKYP